MAVQVNATSENDGGSGKKYTGVGVFRVTHVNPTQEELKALGYKAEKAPEYFKDGKRRVVFMVEATAPGGDKIKTNVAFFLEEKKADQVWINKYGQYSKERDKVEGDVRNPYEGEIDLLEFIRAWGNVKKGAELALDTIDAVVKSGDVSEIRSIAKALTDGFVKLMLTVSEDGKYQRVYTRKFERAFSKDYSYLHKDIVKNKQYIKEHLGPIDFALYTPEQFTLREWKGDTADLAAAGAKASNGNGKAHPPVAGANNAPATGETPAGGEGDDEAPF